MVIQRSLTSTLEPFKFIPTLYEHLEFHSTRTPVQHVRAIAINAEGEWPAEGHFPNLVSLWQPPHLFKATMDELDASLHLL